MGRITCQFYQRQAPKAVANFIALAEGTKDWTDPTTRTVQHNKPLFNGTTFHRVIPQFMIQGGDPTGTGMGSPGYKFEDEVDPNLNFDRAGRLAMANSGPNTNGSQFFITEQPTEFLNQHYTLFGQCDDASVQVVKAIARVPRNAQDKPNTPWCSEDHHCPRGQDQAVMRTFDSTNSVSHVSPLQLTVAARPGQP